MVGAAVVVGMLALLVGDRTLPEDAPPAPTPTPPRAERLAREMAERRRQLVASLTPTPDVDLEQIRAELVLRQTEVCADACPRSAPGDCTLRELRVTSREDASIGVGYAVACGPVRDVSGRWVYHSRMIPRSASFDRFASRWLLVGFGAPSVATGAGTDGAAP